jgi:hypothetical protein
VDDSATERSDRGAALASEGRLEEALAEQTRAIEEEPGLAIAHSRRADVLAKMCQRDEGRVFDLASRAEADLERAIALATPELRRSQNLDVRLLAVRELIRRTRPRAGCAGMLLLGAVAICVPALLL